MTEVTKQLTAKERAVLWVRRWREGEEPDANVARSAPLEQTAEYERLVGLVQGANQAAYSALAFLQCWVLETDRYLAWAESLLAWERRCDVLTARLEEEGIKVQEDCLGRSKTKNFLFVEPLPLLTHGFTPDMPLLFGGVNGPDWNENPPAVGELPGILLPDAAQGVAWRWQEMGALETVLTELGEREFEGRGRRPSRRRAFPGAPAGQAGAGGRGTQSAGTGCGVPVAQRGEP